MTHAKVCGFRSAVGAIAAIDAGADAIGLVFVPSAGRRVTVDEASDILREVRAHLAGREQAPEIVGLFADQPAEEVNDAVERLALDSVQLCGSEGMAYAAQMTVPVYKVISIDPNIPISSQLPKVMVLQQRHQLAGHGIVIDTMVAGEYGGTGQRFDWELAAGLAEGFDMSLAGGLTPDNVGEAVAQVRPWGVDTSSGVETDGEKDPAKIRAFIEAVREADAALARSPLKRLLGRGRS